MGDFRGDMPLQKFRTARYPQPAIILDTPFKTNIKREYVIWGLFLAVASMLDQHVYEMSQFDLLWHGEEIGSITFGDFSSMLDTLSRESPGRSTLNTAKPKEILVQNTSMAPTATGARTPSSIASLANATQVRSSPRISDDRLSVVFTSHGDDVGIVNLLVYMLGVLALTAIPPSNIEITARWKPIQFLNICQFELVPSTREEPPFMMFFWLIEAIAEAARYVVENDEYRSLNMLISADGQIIGYSSFVCLLP